MGIDVLNRGPFGMPRTASLPMYNLPEMRAVNARFWQVLRGLLIEAGLGGIPEILSFDRRPVPERIGPEVLFSQTCGYPLETIFRGQAVRVGTPCYDAEGCDGPSHCGLFVVPAGSRAGGLSDLRGGIFLLNHRHSNSGMNLPRRALAEVAEARPFFAQVIETGSHPGNLDRIARGEGRRHRGRLRDLRLLDALPTRGGAAGPRPGADGAEPGDPFRNLRCDPGRDRRDIACGIARNRQRAASHSGPTGAAADRHC